MRVKVWLRSSLTTGTSPVILDIDASLVEIHTEGQDEGRSHLQGWLSASTRCSASPTPPARCLSGLLRPGNAGANTVADHLSVLDAGRRPTAAEIARGHRRR